MTFNLHQLIKVQKYKAIKKISRNWRLNFNGTYLLLKLENVWSTVKLPYTLQLDIKLLQQINLPSAMASHMARQETNLTPIWYGNLKLQGLHRQKLFIHSAFLVPSYNNYYVHSKSIVFIAFLLIPTRKVSRYNFDTF